ncbi:fibrinogen C domain-containing protein 1-like [Ostrea edulis]|uniref:fibrinogen C domain-containing protein 1-like n=1 Tax=Ostrea edulis TaxID=37623 RepID=UPI0024AEC7CE|nr:fibrinogen C domain-containing protein 1-like [Ostrea edulis]
MTAKMTRKQTLVLVMNVILYCDARFQESYSKLQYGYRLDRKTITSFVEFSILDCAEECLKTTRCKSVSYYKGANFCEINYENRFSARDRFVESPGWTYSEKEDWDIGMVSFCSASNCSINEKCKPLPVAKFECVLSDCGIPSQEGVNLSSVGRWDGIGIQRFMTLDCYQNYIQSGSRMFVCTQHGQWTTKLKCERHKSCMEILQSDPSVKGKDGVYSIILDDQKKKVYCDMTTDGGGWTVIQKRQDGSTDFYRNWADYKEGFGDPSKNYWLGNEAIHYLTKTNQELRVDLLSFDDEKAYALYSTFQVEDESSKYQLTVSGYSGTAGDSLKYHNGHKFTTHDEDNDGWSSNNCAVDRHGAWWYRKCANSNLNGQYTEAAVSGKKYPCWYGWKSFTALKGTSMQIRTKNQHQ